MSLAIKTGIKTSRRILYTVAAAFIFLLYWSSNYEIEKGVRAQGQVIALARTQIIQSPEVGVVSEIKVKEGDEVKKGQVLVELQKERALAAYENAKSKVAALRITLARLKSEVYEKELKFDDDLLVYKEFIENQTALYKRRKRAIDETIKSLKESLSLAKEELAMNQPLLKTRDVGKADILKLKRGVTDLKGQITAKNNTYFQDAQAEMTKVQEELATQEQNLLDRQQLLQHTILEAPMDGIVKELMISTVGAVLRQGDEVMKILPTESDLIVEAKIQPMDMSNLLIGLPALIKLDAYDYSIYGAMIGELEYISPDALKEDNKNGENIYYQAKIRIKEKEFKNKFAEEIQVNPGMTVTIDIKTGTRTVLSYLTKPLTKTLDEALLEK